MNFIKLLLLAGFTLVIISCASTPAEKIKQKKDKQAAKLNTQLASGYIRRGELEVAKEKLLKALKFDEEYVPAYTTMAVLMDLVNEHEEAQNYYLEALDLDPKNPELLNNYGTFLCKAGDIEEAVKQFRQTLRNQFYQTPEIAHANIGYCLLQGKKPDFKLIEKHLRQALKRRKNLPSALLAMAEVGIASKQYLMARAYTQRYNAINQPSAYSLWVQIQAEHALGDKKYFLKLSHKLLKEFPESEEAEKLMGLSNL